MGNPAAPGPHTPPRLAARVHTAGAREPRVTSHGGGRRHGHLRKPRQTLFAATGPAQITNLALDDVVES